MVQSKLLHSEDVERELRQLQEENTALRNHTDNVGLMRYQLQTLREQLKRNEDMEKRVVRLEEENKSLHKQLEEFKGGRGGIGGRYISCFTEYTTLRDVSPALQVYSAS